MLNVFKFLGMIICHLPKKENLLIRQTVINTAKIVFYLKIRNPIFKIVFLIFSLESILSSLLQPAGNYLLHYLLDIRRQLIKSQMFYALRGEMMSGQIFDDSAGDESAGAVGRLILVGQILHELGRLVNDTNFSDLHLLSKVQRGAVFTLRDLMNSDRFIFRSVNISLNVSFQVIRRRI